VLFFVLQELKMRQKQFSRRVLLQSAATIGSAAAVSGAFPGTALAASASADGERNNNRDTIVATDIGSIVETECGKVRGFERNGIHIFKGIPYGAPTGGKNRFMPPQKPEPWSGIRSALYYEHVSPQPPRESWNHDENAFLFHWDDGQPGEDCLRMNVWTPGINDNRKRTVMVWMHGGGYVAGSGQELAAYEGENLSRRGDVVVVSMNHRLGAFGFLNLAEAGGDRYASSGNAGMLDLVLSLEWVRDNIANFGGDPKSVMIFGQSGGGGKVNTLMAMPSAKGLFHRAGVQSGSLMRVGDPHDSYELASTVLKQLNISPSDVDQLQAIPTDQLLLAATTAQRSLMPPRNPNAPPVDFRHLGKQLGWQPVVDGKVIPQQTWDPTAPQLSAEVPLLVGSVLNEFVTGMDQPDAFSMTNEDLEKKISATYGSDKSKEIIDTFRQGHPKANPFQLHSIISVASVRQTAIKQSRLQAALGQAPAFLYWFTWQTPILNGRPMAFHCAELSFCFDNSDRCETMTGGGPRARALGAKMSQAWIEFAKKGDPNHGGLPHWAPVSADKVPTMIFDDVCEAKDYPDRLEQKVMDSVG
jgi:para-nitrobenzyl esterase